MVWTGLYKLRDPEKSIPLNAKLLDTLYLIWPIRSWKQDPPSDSLMSWISHKLLHARSSTNSTAVVLVISWNTYRLLPCNYWKQTAWRGNRKCVSAVGHAGRCSTLQLFFWVHSCFHYKLPISLLEKKLKSVGEANIESTYISGS